MASVTSAKAERAVGTCQTEKERRPEGESRRCASEKKRWGAARWRMPKAHVIESKEPEVVRKTQRKQ